MPDSPIKIDVAGWVEQARTNPAAHRQRQGVVTILNAIAAKAPLNKKMFLKGGILMGLAYDSPRQTVDIDLTTSLKAENYAGEWIRTQILEVFIEKCRSRDLEPTQTSLGVPEVKERSGAKWETMELEVGEIPDFGGCYTRVSEFYENLPWGRCA